MGEVLPFDEIPEAIKKRSLSEIDDLASEFDALRIIATSRPHHAIEMSAHFTNVKLDNLKDREYQNVISTLSKRDAWADVLIEHIEQRARHVRPLLCTPLMVTLLVLTYKSHKQLPSQLSGFYDSLFFTLLQRHDGTKPGFTRRRGCSLDDEQYRQVFEAMCIISKEKSELVFTYKDVYAITKRALAETHQKAKPAEYLDDIVKITCLLVHDGDEYRFIHKTVQEYYAAAFIAKKPDPWARKFYERMHSLQDYQRWHEELSFLREIDRYRHDKYFLLPALLNYLGLNEVKLQGELPRLTDEQVTQCLEPFELSFNNLVKTERLSSLGFSSVLGFQYRGFLPLLFGQDYTPVCEAIASGVLKVGKGTRGTRELLREISAAEVFHAGVMTKELRQIIEKIACDLFQKAVETYRGLSQEENDDILKGLI